MRWPALAIPLGFGTAIALLLGAAQLASLAWPPPRGDDFYAGSIGLMFLTTGILLGRRRRHERTAPVAAPQLPAGSLHAVPVTATPGPTSSLLTRRELQVLQALAEGCSNAEIADQQFVSVNTVKTHVRQICSKLDAPRRGIAVARARQIGLLDSRPGTERETGPESSLAGSR